LTTGFSSGEIEIISIDQDSSTGFIYIVGTSTATELLVSGATKSVFTALFNGIEFAWFKLINDISVDTVEFMSAMGTSSQNFIIYVTKSSSPFIPIIFIVSKTDGSIVRSFDINDPSGIKEINPLSK